MRIIAIGVAAFAMSLAGAALAASATVTVQPVPDLRPDFMMGADLSMLDQLDHSGARFYENGQRGDAMAIVKDNGVNWVRLRLWHTPVNSFDVIENGRTISHRGDPMGGGNNDLATTIRLAQRAKALGLKFLLDIHYSDFWVDPQKQNKPAAWRKLSGPALEDAVHQYTVDVLDALKKADVYPDMIQVGNELNGGMLWPDGKTFKSATDEKIGGDDGFVALMSAGIRGVRETDPHHDTPEHVRVVVHLADGGDNSLYRRVFDLFTKRGVDYDVIGLSFYPYYHGPIKDLRANMDDISARYGKDVAVVETAYAYTTRDGDGFPNLFNADMQKSVGYLATVQGQASMVRDIIDALAQVPGHRGLGIFYWEPDWVPAPRAGWRTGEGNGWDNQAMFDFDGNALPSLAVFKRVRETLSPEALAANTPHMLEAGPLRLEAFVGEPWTPPESVRLRFSDDATREIPVMWDDVPPKALAEPGHFTLAGQSIDGLKVTADVAVASRRNLFQDGSFEQHGDLGEWTFTGDVAAASNERNAGNAHSGSRSFHYWAGTPFRFEATHTFTGLADGVYAFKVWAAGSGSEKQVQFIARDCGGNASPRTVDVTNTGWQKWKQYTIGGIRVTGGHCTIAFDVEGPTGAWGNFDDTEFAHEDAK